MSRNGSIEERSGHCNDVAHVIPLPRQLSVERLGNDFDAFFSNNFFFAHDDQL